VNVLWQLVHAIEAATIARRDAISATRAHTTQLIVLGTQVEKLASNVERAAVALEKLVAGPPTDRRAVSIYTIGPPRRDS
jgi:hypothetical protein